MSFDSFSKAITLPQEFRWDVWRFNNYSSCLVIHSILNCVMGSWFTCRDLQLYLCKYKAWSKFWTERNTMKRQVQSHQWTSDQKFKYTDWDYTHIVKQIRHIEDWRKSFSSVELVVEGWREFDVGYYQLIEIQLLLTWSTR